MKRINLLILLTAFAVTLFVPKALAQGSSMAAATTIEVGQEMTTTFPAGSEDLVTTFWYKVPVEAGVWYELPWATSHSVHFSADGSAGNASYHSNVQYNYSYNGYVGLIYRPTENGTYFISIRYVESSPNPLSWTFEEITDNRICEMAKPVVLGVTEVIPTGQMYHWYSKEFEASKYYRIDGGVYALDRCGGSVLFSRRDFVYHSPRTETAYMRVGASGQQAVDTALTITEYTPEVNITCSAAKELTVGQPTEFVHTDRNMWFKVYLEGGVDYRVTLPWDAQRTQLHLYDECGGEVLQEVVTAYYHGLSYTPSKSGTFYLNANYHPFYNLENAMECYWIKVDLSPCQKAESATVGETVVYAHDTEETKELWWKIELEAGEYMINRQSISGSTFAVFTDCSATTQIGNNGFLGIQTAGTYYVKSSANFISESDIGSFEFVKLGAVAITCDTANEIELDQSIATSFPNSTNAWYKVALEGGKVYQIHDGNAPWGDEAFCYVYTRCGTNQEIARSSYYLNSIFLYPEADAVYYLKWTGQHSHMFTWHISEVTDNRICDFATPFAIGEEVMVPNYNNSERPKTDDYGYKHYWYTLDVKAGKYYEVDFSKADYSEQWGRSQMVICSACKPEQRIITSFSKSKTLLKADQNTVWYFDVQSSRNSTRDFAFSVAEKDQGDNRLCELASVVTLDSDITADHSNHYPYLWYKMNLTADEVYEIDAVNSAYPVLVYRDGICNTTEYVQELLSVNSGEKKLFVPDQTGTYYFQTGTIFNPSQSGSWKISKTQGDNRLCAYADLIELGTPFNVSHRNYDNLWYKFPVKAGAMYEVGIPETYYENMTVYDACGSDIRVGSGYANSFFFTAQTTDDYYISFYNGSAKPTFECTISEVLDNRSCIYAVEATPGESMTATKDAMWYTVSLTAGIYYEFDFATEGDPVWGELYNACNDDVVLEFGENEKLLYKATRTGQHLLKVSKVNNSEGRALWSYNETDARDNRLCEFAEAIGIGTEITADFSNGFGRRWYEINVVEGKYYQVTNELGYFFADCDPESIIQTPFAEANATWYVYVPKHWYEETTFIVQELSPDGRVCAFGKEIKLGETVTNEKMNVLGYVTRGDEEGDGDGDYEYYHIFSGSWYRLPVEETGTYEIQLEEWEYYEALGEESYHPYWEVYIGNSCGSDERLMDFTHALGHTFNIGRISFEATANSDVYILTDDWGWGDDNRTFKVIKKSVGTVVISGKVKTDEEAPITNAVIKLYRKKTQSASGAQGVRRVSKDAIDLTLWELIALVHSDEAGNYSFDNLGAGQYMLTIEMEGFTMEEGAEVTVAEEGAVSSVDFVADSKTGTIVGEESTGLVDAGTLKFKFYPNPTKGLLYINLDSDDQHVRVVINDISGRAMFKSDYNNEQHLTVDLSLYPSGIYFVSVIGERKSSVMKVLKK